MKVIESYQSSEMEKQSLKNAFPKWEAWAQAEYKNYEITIYFELFLIVVDLKKC